MAVPKQRKTKSRRDQRRMHIYLKEQEITECSNCGEEKMPHRACGNCGFYNGKSVISPQLEEKEEKDKEREEERKEKRLSMENLSQ